MKKSRFFEGNKRLKNILKKGAEEGVFSGAAAGVYLYSKNGEEKHIFFEGTTRKDEKGIPVSETTFFDLASLTKPLCTVLTTLYLIEKKSLQLNTHLFDIYGKKCPKEKKKITIKNLLCHSSGTKAYIPFYKEFEPQVKKENTKEIINAILQEKLDFPVGQQCVYSDLDYMLLGDILEKTSGQPLNDLYREVITLPCNLDKEIFFQPVDKLKSARQSKFAATQRCPWRKKTLQGEVDDEHSWLMNGVAGHAGLFGTIDGVLTLCALILNMWKGRGVHPAFSKNMLIKALSRQFSDQPWCLGFDTPSIPSSGGRYISPHSVGHLGFTGTSFWIDPEKEVVVVLLTNRVHPDRQNDKIKKFRPLFHDTVFAHLNT